MKKIWLFLILLISIEYAQTSEPEIILDKAKEIFNMIEDYEVDVKIKVDVEFLKIPVTNAKIFFKKPDKFHVQSKTFALIPREGLDLSPLSLLKNEYTPFFVRHDTIGGHKTSVIKIIPLEDSGDIILTTLWIDREKYLVRRIESSTKLNGTFLIELNYSGSPAGYPLASSMVFTFNVDEVDLPDAMDGHINRDKKPKKGRTTGKVYITYSDYKINKGIPDEVFEEKKE